MEKRALKYVESLGAARNIELGFVPNWVHTTNITKIKTVSQNTELWWNSKMADASYYGYATQNPVTNGMLPVSDTSNGFTPYDTSVREARAMIITGVSQANPGVVTIGAGHGLTAANDGEYVSINLIGAGSMVELNGGRYAITYINATTFYIDIDTTSLTAWSGTYNYGIAMVEDTRSEDTGFKGITLGTIPMANSGDVILLEAAWFDSFATV